MQLFLFVALAALAGSQAQVMETDYVQNGNEVYFYVYRVHGVLKPLANDNAASPGGEVAFLTQEYGYQNGIILRDCVSMTNAPFSQYQCCNGGSCSSCSSDAGSGTSNNANMPGRAFQIYPPTGAPCSQSSTTCSGNPSAPCTGQCTGWWYSFQSSGECAAGDAIGTNGCTWKSHPTISTIQFGDLVKQSGWSTSTQAYTQMHSDAQMLVNAFSNPTNYVNNGGSFTTTTDQAPSPSNFCQTQAAAPAPPPSSDGDGDADAGDADGGFVADSQKVDTQGASPHGLSPLATAGVVIAGLAVVGAAFGVAVVRRRRARAANQNLVPLLEARDYVPLPAPLAV